MTTVTIGANRDALLDRLHAGRSDDFLTAATSYLQTNPDDHHVRLMMLREYLKLGLTVPARELLEADSGASLPQAFDAVRSKVSRLAGGVISWSSLADRFEGNLAALAERGVGAGEVSRHWHRRQSRFELFRDSRGVEQVRMTDGAGRWHWVPRLGNHPADDAGQSLPTAGAGPMPPPVLFEGLDLGGLFERVYDATLRTFHGYSCALFVLEPDAALLALVLHLRDWRRIIADPRVHWFVGEGCSQRLRSAWDDVDLPLPSHGYRLSRFRPSGSAEALGLIQRLSDERERAIEVSLAELEARYARRDRLYWANRFEEALSGRGEPLRILAAVSTHTTFLKYSMRDAQRAFESMGHRCMVLTEKTPYHVVSPLTYHQAIRTLDPDLFFNIDHLRPEFAGLLPAGLPVLTWDQDQLPHVFTEANMRAVGALDFVAGYSKTACVLAGCDPRQFLFARVPTCPDQFSGEPLTNEEHDRFSCDVSFVSHASQTPRQFHEEERARLRDPAVGALLDVMFELALDRLREHAVMWGHLPHIIVDEAARRIGVPRPEGDLRSRLITWYLWRLGDRVFRHEALEWVAAWARRTGRSFRIYGNGWSEHPTLGVFAAGPADNGRELLCIHRASRVNLQLMPAGFIHQRALDGLAAGGFFMSRATPSDVRGHLLRRIDTRIGQLGVATTRELLEADDTELKSLLERYYGPWLPLVDRGRQDFYVGLRVPAEELYPDEVFPAFDEILFDSAEAFAAKADRFLADEIERQRLVEEMRTVVVNQFSYRAAMHRFLTAMAGYLAEAAG